MTLLRKDKLESFKKELLARREALASELRQATADFINDDETYTDSIDQASADADKSLAVQMKNRGRDSLVELNEAIRRIDAGSFGECQECGEDITEARMRANPSTTLCIDCKSELESEQTRFPGRAS